MSDFPKLDDIDRLLLAEVQRDNRQSIDALSAKVNCSASAVQRRLTKLRASGVIEADISIVSQEAMGWPMTFIVEVGLERERIDLLDTFRDTMRKLDEVQQCYYVTGNTDFILVVSTTDMRAYEDFSRRVFSENPNIRTYASHVVVNCVKNGRQVAVPASDGGSPS